MLALSIKHNFSFNQTQLFFQSNTNQSNTSSSKIPKLNSSLYPQNLSLPHPPPKKDYHNTHKEPLFSFSQGWSVVGNNFYRHSCWQTLPFSLGWTQSSTLWQSYSGHLTHTLPLFFRCPPFLLRAAHDDYSFCTRCSPRFYERWTSAERVLNVGRVLLKQDWKPHLVCKALALIWW